MTRSMRLALALLVVGQIASAHAAGGQRLIVIGSLAVVSAASAPGQPVPPPTAASRAIAIENAKRGTTDWLLTAIEPIAGTRRDDRNARHRAIEGFVSHTSIRPGETLSAFVSTQPAVSYRADVYRMGYYGGTGARLMRRLGPFAGAVQNEPIERDKRLAEARWRPSFQVPIGRDWSSGVYLAKLTTAGSGYQSYLVWVVRDDRKADLMFQVSDLTWQAYNRWPAWRSLYDWKDEKWRTTPGSRVSFDRPYAFYYNMLPVGLEPVTNGSGEFLLWEFPLLFWLESQGYDVTYVSNLDTHADGEGLLRVKGFLSVGHDEYWTRQMMENVTRARDRGVSLAFLSGNSVDGEITLEASHDGRPHRVFGRFEGRGDEDDFPNEHLVMGATSYGVGLGDWVIARAEHWLFEGSGVKTGDSIQGLVGWEYHGPPLRDAPSLVVVATAKVYDSRGKEQAPDFAATIYTGPRDNVVFNAGTCWWSLLLSSPPGFVSPAQKDFARQDPRVQRITHNLLARIVGR